MSDTTKRIVIGEAIVLAAWLVVLFALRDLYLVLDVRPVVYTSLLFGLVAFVASAVSLVLGDRPTDATRALAEVNALPVVVSCGYFAVALVANTAFCLAAPALVTNTVPVVVNVLLLAATAVIRLGVGSYQNKAAARTAHAAQKTRNSAVIGSHIGELLARAQDPTVRAELHKLKEDYDFSPNVSQEYTAGLDEQFLTLLGSISASLDRGDAPDATIALVRQADALWMRRNAVTTSIK